MPAVIPIALGVGAAYDIYQGHQANKRADKASQAQTDAVDKTITHEQDTQQKMLDMYERMWREQQQMQAPWTSTGRNALGTLSQMMGLPVPEGAGGNVPINNQTAGGLRGQPMTLGRMGGPVGPGQQGSYTDPQMVTIQAPDGSRRQVPKTMAPHYLTKGGKVVQ